MVEYERLIGGNSPWQEWKLRNEKSVGLAEPDAQKGIVWDSMLNSCKRRISEVWPVVTVNVILDFPKQ